MHDILTEQFGKLNSRKNSARVFALSTAATAGLSDGETNTHLQSVRLDVDGV